MTVHRCIGLSSTALLRPAVLSLTTDEFWWDGNAYISQCPFQSGGNMTYRFQVGGWARGVGVVEQRKVMRVGLGACRGVRARGDGAGLQLSVPAQARHSWQGVFRGS